MFTSADARSLAQKVPEPFDSPGNECDPDETLEATQGDLNRLRIRLDSTREDLAIEKSKHRQTAQELACHRDRFEAIKFEL
jgi:hypothetical protein